MSISNDVQPASGSSIGLAERHDSPGVVDISRAPILHLESIRSDGHLFQQFASGRGYLRVKRWLDVVAAALLLVVSSWLIVAIALAIQLTSSGSAFFIQTRVGENMKPFRCFKFRTMVFDAEKILIENPQLKDSMAVAWKIHSDPRVTGIGKVLRKTSLDELPQLINVLKGEMSLVGPRPVQVTEMAEMYGAYGPVVTSVRPGMTGLWQVSGRSRLTYEQRVGLDLQYVHSFNFKRDVIILFKTIHVVIRGNGAS